MFSCLSTRRYLFLSVFLLLLVGIQFPAIGQDKQPINLVEQYSRARFRLRINELLDILGLRAIPRDLAHIPTRADTLLQIFQQGKQKALATEPSMESRRKILFGKLEWRKIEPNERHWFMNKFREVEWTSAGMPINTVVDTMPAPLLRARLEALFGPPSNTIVDIAREKRPSGKEFIEFEYWFVINEEIPFIVLDVDGPFEEGLVFAGSWADVDMLGEIKRDFVRKILSTPTLAPYVDYYYAFDEGVWYRTGYDGRNFFVERIPPPDISKGRPHLASR